MQERPKAVTMKGNPLTLVGSRLDVGDTVPDCELTGNDLNPVKLSSFQGKVRIISSVPSLDTSVCDAMTRRFNKKAAKLGRDLVVLTVSMDLPFAQKRWCAAAGIENVLTLSDHRRAYFGKNFGLLIKELRILARAVFVIDKQGNIRYKELVNELTDEPDYQSAVLAAKNLLQD